MHAFVQLELTFQDAEWQEATHNRDMMSEILEKASH